MQNDEMHPHQQPSPDHSVEELCCTVFYMARYAEAMEIDKTITIEDERELFWMILDWSQKFEQSFDPCGTADYQTELECQGPRWLRETFPYHLELDEEQVDDIGPGMVMPGM